MRQKTKDILGLAFLQVENTNSVLATPKHRVHVGGGTSPALRVCFDQMSFFRRFVINSGPFPESQSPGSSNHTTNLTASVHILSHLERGKQTLCRLFFFTQALTGGSAPISVLSIYDYLPFLTREFGLVCDQNVNF